MLQFSQSIHQNLNFLIHVIYKIFNLLFTVDDADTLRISIVSDPEFFRYSLSKFPKIKRKLKSSVKMYITLRSQAILFD